MDVRKQKGDACHRCQIIAKEVLWISHFRTTEVRQPHLQSASLLLRSVLLNPNGSVVLLGKDEVVSSTHASSL
jgi:hypothetical protein